MYKNLKNRGFAKRPRIQWIVAVFKINTNTHPPMFVCWFVMLLFAHVFHSSPPHWQRRMPSLICDIWINEFVTGQNGTDQQHTGFNVDNNVYFNINWSVVHERKSETKEKWHKESERKRMFATVKTILLVLICALVVLPLSHFGSLSFAFDVFRIAEFH